MGNDCGVSCRLGHGNCIEGLREAANLVKLNQDRVRHTLFNSLIEYLCISDEQVIPHQLHLVADLVSQHFPTVPVRLVQTILYRNNRMTAGKVGQIITEAFTIVLLALTRQIIDAIAIKLGSGTVQRQGNVATQFISGPAHRLGNNLKGCLVGRQIGRKSPLVPYCCAQTTRRQYLF